VVLAVWAVLLVVALLRAVVTDNVMALEGTVQARRPGKCCVLSCEQGEQKVARNTYPGSSLLADSTGSRVARRNRSVKLFQGQSTALARDDVVMLAFD
jgi:hypothetical protein